MSIGSRAPCDLLLFSSLEIVRVNNQYRNQNNQLLQLECWWLVGTVRMMMSGGKKACACTSAAGLMFLSSNKIDSYFVTNKPSPGRTHEGHTRGGLTLKGGVVLFIKLQRGGGTAARLASSAGCRLAVYSELRRLFSVLTFFPVLRALAQ